MLKDHLLQASIVKPTHICCPKHPCLNSGDLSKQAFTNKRTPGLNAGNLEQVLVQPSLWPDLRQIFPYPAGNDMISWPASACRSLCSPSSLHSEGVDQPQLTMDIDLHSHFSPMETLDSLEYLGFLFFNNQTVSRGI
jgi:hypothetical protein